MSFLDQINLKFFLVLQFYSPVEEAHTQQEENAGFPDGSVIKNPPANARDTCLIPGHEDPLEKEIAIHSSVLAQEIPWTEKPDRLQSMGSQRVRHGLASKTITA